VVCEYCQSEVTIERYAVKAAEYRGALSDYSSAVGGSAPTVTIANVRYELRGRLATGHSSDVWLGRRATRLGERVVLKLLRDAEDEPLLGNEQRMLRALSQSNERGTDFFSTLLPQPVAYGRCERADAPWTMAAVFREPVGFSHTLQGVRRALGTALDARHAVWIWRRTLELLSWVHQSGVVHGAILPEHVLIHARDHGTRLVGWSCAVARGGQLRVAAAADLGLYPEPVLSGAGLTPQTDLIMLARSLQRVLDMAAVPKPLARVLDREASGRGGEDAWALAEELSGAARDSFGAPKYVELVLPGT
jgi:hypothetical protein